MKEFTAQGREPVWTRRADHHVGDIIWARVAVENGALVVQERLVDIHVRRGSQLDLLGIIRGRGVQVRSFGVEITARHPRGTAGIYRGDYPGPGVPPGLPGLPCGVAHAVDSRLGRISLTIPTPCLGDVPIVSVSLSTEHWVDRGSGGAYFADVPGRHGWWFEDAWSAWSPRLTLSP